MKNKALTYYLKYVSCGYICDNACKSKKENIPHQTKKEKKVKKRQMQSIFFKKCVYILIRTRKTFFFSLH